MAGKLVLLRLSLAGNQEKSPKGGSVAMDSVMKSNTVTRFKTSKIVSSPAYGTVYRITGEFL
jgi:hypothetical protein